MAFDSTPANAYYPHNSAAEMAVLSAFVKDTTLNLVHNIDAKDFYDTRNKNIFYAIRNLSTKNESVTPADIIDNLKSVSAIGAAGGEDYITGICNSRINEIMLCDRIKSVQDFRARRSTIAFGLDIISQAASDSTSESLIGYVNQGLAKVFPTTADMDIPVGDAAYEAFKERLRAYQEGNVVKCVNFNIAPLDNFFNQQLSIKSNYIVIGATPSTGKTALAGQGFFWNLIEQGYKVFFASQEMSSEEIINRIVAHVSGKALSYINTGRFLGAEGEAVLAVFAHVRDVISQHGEIYDASGMSIETINAKSRAFKRKQKGRLDLILLDYIQAIDIEAKRTAAEHEKIAAISRALKGMGKDLGCIVTALSQITLENGALEPEMKHLRGSKNIAQDADIVILLSVAESHRELQGHDIIKINFAKGRSIGTGVTHAKFTPKFMRFEDPVGYVRDLTETAESVFGSN